MPGLPVRHTHLHSGQVASMGSSKPAISGALVDINILQVYVHSHHAPAKQFHIIKLAVEKRGQVVSSNNQIGKFHNYHIYI